MVTYFAVEARHRALRGSRAVDELRDFPLRKRSLIQIQVHWGMDSRLCGNDSFLEVGRLPSHAGLNRSRGSPRSSA
jgi:hypothetical protein